MSYYCRFCGKVLTTADDLDRCNPSCPESLERKTGLMITLQPDDYVVLVKERDTLRAENEDLVEALQKIKNWSLETCEDYEMSDAAYSMRDVAEEALNEVTK